MMLKDYMKKIFWLIFVALMPCSTLWAQQDKLVNQLLSAEYNLSTQAAGRGVFNAYQSYCDEHSLIFSPAPQAVQQYLKNRPNLPDVLEWKPSYAKIAKSGEWGFTTGPVSWQFVGNTRRYGQYVHVWKKDQKGEWKLAYQARMEHPKPGKKLTQRFDNPTDRNFTKLRSQARIKQREDIIFSTDQLFATVLKADNPTAFKEFFLPYSRFYFPRTEPLIGAQEAIDFVRKNDINILSSVDKVDRSYSGELALSYGDASIYYGKDPDKHGYLRIWELQEDKLWKVVVDLYVER